MLTVVFFGHKPFDTASRNSSFEVVLADSLRGERNGQGAVLCLWVVIFSIAIATAFFLYLAFFLHTTIGKMKPIRKNAVAPVDRRLSVAEEREEFGSQESSSGLPNSYPRNKTSTDRSKPSTTTLTTMTMSLKHVSPPTPVFEENVSAVSPRVGSELVREAEKIDLPIPLPSFSRGQRRLARSMSFSGPMLWEQVRRVRRIHSSSGMSANWRALRDFVIRGQVTPFEDCASVAEEPQSGERTPMSDASSFWDHATHLQRCPSVLLAGLVRDPEKATEDVVASSDGSQDSVWTLNYPYSRGISVATSLAKIPTAVQR